MRELVGTCCKCGREIYCLDGFLNGIINNAKEMYCFQCEEKKEEPPRR